MCWPSPGLQAFALGANWDMELARLKILADGRRPRRCARWTTPIPRITR